MKKLFAILLALSMLLALAACGDSGPADPNCGVYVGDTVEAFGVTMKAADVFGDDFSIELLPGGKAVLHYDGDTQKLKWSLNGTAFHAEGGGEKLDGTLADSVLVFPDFIGTGMSATFVNRDYAAPAVEDKADPADAKPTAEHSWWEGKWYGWGVYYMADGDYAEYEDKTWDAVADITVKGDQGTFTLYDIDKMETPEIEAQVRFESGLSEAGKMVCVSGTFMEDLIDFSEGEWETDPAADPEGSLEHTFMLTFVYQDDSGSVRVCYVLRPWGMLWDDVAAADLSEMLYTSVSDMMPNYYEDWYLPQLGINPTSAEPAAEPAPAPTSFEEITVIDNDDCLIKITGINPDNIWGYTLTVYLENRSEDLTYRFSVDNGSVNGVEWDPFFSAELAPGKKANEEISFYDSYKETILTQFTDIELSFLVRDSEDWSAPETARKTVHVYPYGEDKATTFVRAPQASDIVLADNDDLTVIVTGFEHDDIWGYVMKLFLVNKTDYNLMFSSDDVSVNGFMCDPYWATSVAPGKVSFSTAYWSDSAFEKNGITEVEEIEMTLKVYDYDSWGDSFDFKQVVTITP